MKSWILRIAGTCAAVTVAWSAAAEPPAWVSLDPWPRHVVDNSSRGADGVRLADANGDGLQDIATGWEEGGVIRVYLNPGHAKAGDPWPSVTVGQVASPEDAVLVDVDGDGAMDVVSSCEGHTNAMYVHWAPGDDEHYMDGAHWTTEQIPATKDVQRWMFALPVEKNGRLRIFAGGKGDRARVGWLTPGAEPSDVASWTWEPVSISMSWIMSIIPFDQDGDGDDEIVVSNRKGIHSGVYTIFEENGKTKTHFVNPGQHEVMFLDIVREAGTVYRTYATRDGALQQQRRGETGDWTMSAIAMPESTGTGKAVRRIDVDGDGVSDLVVSCENAEDAHGVFWLAGPDFDVSHTISGLEGIKYDRMEAIDLDGDGDLDILTCEERTNLGVIWYENPTK